jgi:predicted enzyme related to lactoylglutathione lyase
VLATHIGVRDQQGGHMTNPVIPTTIAQFTDPAGNLIGLTKA